MIPCGFAQDKNAVTVEVYGAADERGRHRFMVYWWDPDFHGGACWRVQAFQKNYGHTLEAWRKRGRRACVVRAEGEW